MKKQKPDLSMSFLSIALFINLINLVFLFGGEKVDEFFSGVSYWIIAQVKMVVLIISIASILFLLIKFFDEKTITKNNWQLK